MEPLGQRHGGEKGLVWLINWDKASIFLLFFSPLVCRKQINKTAMADVQFLERERGRETEEETTKLQWSEECGKDDAFHADLLFVRLSWPFVWNGSKHQWTEKGL